MRIYLSKPCAITTKHSIFLFNKIIVLAGNKNVKRMERMQHAKKVVSDSRGLVDFAIGLVNFVLNFPDGQAKIFLRIKITKVLEDKCFTCKFLINSCRP